jgi:hypothetical protein
MVFVEAKTIRGLDEMLVDDGWLYRGRRRAVFARKWRKVVWKAIWQWV